jgi:hypothetical protein
VSPMTAEEVARARERFRLDQEHAEYVEYLQARARISRTWKFRRALRRFLRDHGYPSAAAGELWEHFPS